MLCTGAGKANKQKAQKAASRPVQKAAVPHNDMFGFLNKLESKKQGYSSAGAATIGTGGSTSGSSVGGVNRPAIGDVKKPTANTKNFSASKIF